MHKAKECSERFELFACCNVFIGPRRAESASPKVYDEGTLSIIARKDGRRSLSEGLNADLVLGVRGKDALAEASRTVQEDVQ